MAAGDRSDGCQVSGPGTALAPKKLGFTRLLPYEAGVHVSKSCESHPRVVTVFHWPLFAKGYGLKWEGEHTALYTFKRDELVLACDMAAKVPHLCTRKGVNNVTTLPGSWRTASLTPAGLKCSIKSMSKRRKPVWKYLMVCKKGSASQKITILKSFISAWGETQWTFLPSFPEGTTRRRKDGV